MSRKTSTLNSPAETIISSVRGFSLEDPELNRQPIDQYVGRPAMPAIPANILDDRQMDTTANSSTNPQPQRADRGGTDPGPRNLNRDRENPGILTPPTTDHRTVPNLQFSFADAHNRLESGGWARAVTERELPIATARAGVNMRLNPGEMSGVREMHGHKRLLCRHIAHPMAGPDAPRTGERTPEGKRRFPSGAAKNQAGRLVTSSVWPY